MGRLSYTMVAIFWIFVAILLGFNIYHSISMSSGELRYITATVTDKQVKRSSVNSNQDQYLIFTKDDNGVVNVFEIEDSILAGRFNSSDVYGGIELGVKYKFGVRGRRIPLLSWYPNLYTYEEIDNGYIVASNS